MSLDKRKAIQRATALIQQGRLDKAIAEYEAILGADPSDPSLYNALGDLYAQAGSTSEAIACYLRLVEVLRAEGLLYRAIAIYKKIIKLDPNNLAALLACADLYAKEGLRAEARHQYLLAAERSLKVGSVKQALELYQRLIHLEPGDTTIAAKLASLLAGGGRQSEAADLLGRLAQEVRAHGRLDDARRLYQQMVEIDPATFTGWYGLGHVEFEAGRLQEAVDHLRRATGIDATSPLPHLLLGHLYERQRRPDLAKAAWRAALRCDPEHQEAHHLLGRLLLKEGDTEAAVREFDAVACSLGKSEEPGRAIAFLGELGAAADHPLIQERLGELLRRSERSGEAKAAYRRAAELYLASGNVEERHRILNRILTLDPEDPEVLAGLATESIGEEGLVTVGHSEPLSSASPIVAGELGGSGATWAQDDPLELHEETPRGVDGAGQEDVTILRAESDPPAEVPDRFAVVNLYLRQGLEAEARSLLRRFVAGDPGYTEASRYLASLESKALVEDATVGQEIEVIHLDPVEGNEGPVPPPALFPEEERKGEPEEKRAGPPPAQPEGEKELAHLMAKMESPGLPAQEKGLGSTATSLDQFPDEPEGLRPVDRSPETCEAHYQLGMAYQEMGLLDDAIAEFRRSATDERLRLPACNMVGLCLLAKGSVEAAIHELGRGLEIVGRPAEEYLGIKYDLATAYQSIGDLAAAEALLRELQTASASFRDVRS
ncbi:MAG: tetratricopeptide repeat protein, partial [Candidatus Methylomirabilis sp.]